MGNAWWGSTWPWNATGRCAPTPLVASLNPTFWGACTPLHGVLRPYDDHPPVLSEQWASPTTRWCPSGAPKAISAHLGSAQRATPPKAPIRRFSHLAIRRVASRHPWRHVTLCPPSKMKRLARTRRAIWGRVEAAHHERIPWITGRTVANHSTFPWGKSFDSISIYSLEMRRDRHSRRYWCNTATARTCGAGTRADQVRGEFAWYGFPLYHGVNKHRVALRLTRPQGRRLRGH